MSDCLVRVLLSDSVVLKEVRKRHRQVCIFRTITNSYIGPLTNMLTCTSRVKSFSIQVQSHQNNLV
jgi:hypothetical protein